MEANDTVVSTRNYLSEATMTAEEAKVVTERIRNNLNDVRKDLLYMWQTQGWNLLGYESWHQYLTNEFTHHHSYLRRQTHAALLEAQLADDGSLIGAHIESHMRPLVEILDDDALRIEAYWAVQDRFADPVAKDYELVAKEVALMHSPYAILKTRYRDGQIGIIDAYAVGVVLDDYNFYQDAEFVTIGSYCNDPNLVAALAKLYEAQTDTWQEVLITNCIPSYDEPIPLRRATAANLRAWLDVTSAEHRAAAIEQNKDYYIERRALTEKILNLLSESRHLLILPESVVDKLFEYADRIFELDMKKGGDE